MLQQHHQDCEVAVIKSRLHSHNNTRDNISSSIPDATRDTASYRTHSFGEDIKHVDTSLLRSEIKPSFLKPSNKIRQPHVQINVEQVTHDVTDRIFCVHHQLRVFSFFVPQLWMRWLLVITSLIGLGANPTIMSHNHLPNYKT
jgi:hypothetical protein